MSCSCNVLLAQVGLDHPRVLDDLAAGRRARAGGPRASPAARCESAMTAAMMCSTYRTVSPSPCRSRSSSIIGCRSAGTSPASTSSSSSTRGSHRQRPGELEPLQPGGGEAPGLLPGLVGEVDPLEHLQGVSAGGGAGALVGVGGDRHVVDDRHRPERAHQLEGADQPGLRDPVGRPAGDVLAVEHDPPGRRLELPGDHGEQRGLAGAVGSDDAEEVTLVDSERHVLDGPQAAEVTGQSLDLEQVVLGDSVRRLHLCSVPKMPLAAGTAR